MDNTYIDTEAAITPKIQKDCIEGWNYLRSHLRVESACLAAAPDMGYYNDPLMGSFCNDGAHFIISTRIMKVSDATSNKRASNDAKEAKRARKTSGWNVLKKNAEVSSSENDNFDVSFVQTEEL